MSHKAAITGPMTPSAVACAPRCFHAAGSFADTSLVGATNAFNRMITIARRVAASDTPVLLHGESGTGKELLARSIHAMSPRASRVFLPLDCVTFGEALFESELFGHERGAFTGADAAKPGLLDLVDGGTLFLDEIGNLALPLQPKLLRLLETRSYRRVGGTRDRHSDFRLVSASNTDLGQMVREGRFRPDLYFRIAVFPIRLPPLRERRADVPLLVDAMRTRIGCRRPYTAGALDALAAYDFPGNVRELLNIVQRACIASSGDEIADVDLPPEVRGPAGTGPAAITPVTADRIVPLAEIEERYLRWALAHHPGSRAALARALGMSERTLYRRLRRLEGPSSA